MMLNIYKHFISKFDYEKWSIFRYAKYLQTPHFKILTRKFIIFYPNLQCFTNFCTCFLFYFVIFFLDFSWNPFSCLWSFCLCDEFWCTEHNLDNFQVWFFQKVQTEKNVDAHKIYAKQVHVIPTFIWYLFIL